MTIYDRHSNSSLSDPSRGGDLLLPQHPSRSLGHPEAYIPIIPAFGSISETLPKYCQCYVSGRDPMLIALSITGMIGRIVRGHHMFIVGPDTDTRPYPTTATTTTAIPTGIKILNRLATMRSARYFSTTPISFIIGSSSSSSFGGFTGLTPANCMIDTLSHDPYSTVAHPHHVLSLGAVYTFFAALHHYILFSKAYCG